MSEAAGAEGDGDGFVAALRRLRAAAPGRTVGFVTPVETGLVEAQINVSGGDGERFLDMAVPPEARWWNSVHRSGSAPTAQG